MLNPGLGYPGAGARSQSENFEAPAFLREALPGLETGRGPILVNRAGAPVFERAGGALKEGTGGLCAGGGRGL